MDRVKILARKLEVNYPITDFNFEDLASEYIAKGGWNENKPLSQAVSDIKYFIIKKLIN